MPSNARKRILILCARNLYRDPGQARLISNRVSALVDKGVDVTVFIFCRKRPSDAQDLGPPYVDLNVSSLRGLFQAAARTVSAVRDITRCGGVVLFSGPHLYPFAYLLTVVFPKIRFIVDKDAVLEESIEYPPEGVLKYVARIRFKIMKWIENQLLIKSAGVLVVSDEMREYVRQVVGAQVPSILMPCSHRTRDIELLAALHARRVESRRILGIRPCDIVFVYNGSMSAWQGFREACDFVTQYERYSQNRCWLLVLTAQRDLALKQALEAGIQPERLIVRTVRMGSPVVIEQSVGDVGLLLRHRSITNRVAFPNKFSDYLLSGLIIVTTDAIPAVSSIVRGYSVGLSLKDVVAERQELKALTSLLLARRAGLRDYYQRCREVAQMLSIDRFVDDFLQDGLIFAE